MIKLLTVIVLSLLASVSAYAEETAFAPETGNYLLVYQTDSSIGMKSLQISVSKGSNGTLSLSCVEPSYKLTGVTLGRFAFQFSVMNPGSKDEKTNQESPDKMLCFVGKPSLTWSMDKNTAQAIQAIPGVYSGTAAVVDAGSNSGISPANSGTFLLYKLP